MDRMAIDEADAIGTLTAMSLADTTTDWLSVVAAWVAALGTWVCALVALAEHVRSRPNGRVARLLRDCRANGRRLLSDMFSTPTMGHPLTQVENLPLYIDVLPDAKSSAS